MKKKLLIFTVLLVGILGLSFMIYTTGFNTLVFTGVDVNGMEFRIVDANSRVLHGKNFTIEENTVNLGWDHSLKNVRILFTIRDGQNIVYQGDLAMKRKRITYRNLK